MLIGNHLDLKTEYSVGALLYTPAINENISRDIIEEKFGRRYSLALCLEDAISDDIVEIAENMVVKTVQKLYEEKKEYYKPLLFVRVRTPEQLASIHERLKDYYQVLDGYIFPKYSLDNADAYNNLMKKINKTSTHHVYMMPILESSEIADYRSRHSSLLRLKEKIDEVKEYVLNIRVGGNDFSNYFRVRRHVDETIYDILPIAQLLSDILSTFSKDYVVSGPVWEYFNGDDEKWRIGLEKEIKRDVLNGFIGKTVIHPKQIAVVNEGLAVLKDDYEDARAILEWNNESLGVGKNASGERMNERKTHTNWARKMVALAELYGIKE